MGATATAELSGTELRVLLDQLTEPMKLGGGRVRIEVDFVRGVLETWKIKHFRIPAGALDEVLSDARHVSRTTMEWQESANRLERIAAAITDDWSGTLTVEFQDGRSAFVDIAWWA